MTCSDPLGSRSAVANSGAPNGVAAESKNLSKNYAIRLSKVCAKLIQIMVSEEVGQSS